MTGDGRPPTPGERRLDRPPSDRYRDAEAASTPSDGAAGSSSRGLLWGSMAALVGAVATVVLGGVLSQTAGLLAVAAATGWAIGIGVKAGAPVSDRRTRAIASVGIAILAVLASQVGLWLYAGSEGGVLPIADYLGQTFGLLVPIQGVLVVGLAWWAAR